MMDGPTNIRTAPLIEMRKGDKSLDTKQRGRSIRDREEKTYFVTKKLTFVETHLHLSDKKMSMFTRPSSGK